MAQFNSLIVTGGARFLNTIKGTVENSEKVGGHSTPASGNASSDQVVLGNDTRLTDARTPTSHTHGNIQNGGTLQTNDITIASGDKIVVTDSSDSAKVARTSISFDGSTATKALTQKGTWETFGTSNLTLGTTSTTALKGDTKYAGSSSAGGAATSAAKLTNTAKIGTLTNPVYFTANGVPDACTYSLNSTVPENAVFTDTQVTQSLSSTNAHYPILFSYAGNADTTANVTNICYRNNSVYINPSTGNIQATQLNGVTIGSSPKFTDTTYESKAAASGGTAVSLCTTGEKYTWNNKASTDTKNTAGSTNNTSDFLYLVGSTSQGTNPQTYSNSNLYAKNGLLSTQGTVVRNDSGKTRVYDYVSSDYGYIATYNSSDKYTILMGGQKGLIGIYDASQNRRGLFWIGGNDDGVLDLYNSSGTSTISLTGQNGNIKCTTINSHAVPAITFGNESFNFTSTTTLSYIGKSISCEGGHRKLVRAYFRYIYGAPTETAASTNSTTVGSYYSECLAYGINGASVCLTFMLNGGETVYLFAKYSNATANRVDIATVDYTN